MDFPSLHSDAFGIDEVYFHQEDVSIELPDTQKLHSVLRAMAEAESAPLRELNYIFCSDPYLLELNKQHLQHDYYTDVITFQHLDGEICGDVYISTDRIVENAQHLKVSFEQELIRVMLHGALHLAGYRDETPELKTEMRSKEDQFLLLFQSAT